MLLDVLPAASRFVSRGPGVEVRSAFSVGPHWDPARLGHGLLLVSDELLLEPEAGFPPHPHRDVDVVSVLLQGELRHEDGTGRRQVVRAGQVQVMSAGSGVVHSEVAGDEPARVLHAQVSAPGSGEPGLAAADLPGGRGLLPVASGLPGLAAPVPLRAAAALLLGRLSDGDRVRLPEAPCLQVVVAEGAVDLQGAGRLVAGDAARLHEGGEELVAVGPALLLVWLVQRIAGPGRSTQQK